MKAYLKQFNQPPRKIRLVATLVRGKSVAQAISLLSFADQKSAEPIRKLIESAAANSGLSKAAALALTVKDIRVDIAVKLKRFMPRAQGSAAAYRRISSHISVVLGEAAAPKVKKVQKRSPKQAKAEVATN
jgi:large subunit ribosomal protein L22